MENNQRVMGTESRRAYSEERRRASRPVETQEVGPPLVRPASPLAVGAKTVAGIGIGLMVVVGGAAVLGVAAETVLIPSLLLKLAGGIAGGGVGMARGLKDTRTPG